jgi:crotonobetainyl-CoA:carnitine CoA-transferase CaiB-like acyl-CoA transferase
MMEERALANVRVCDFTGQLAGAGATRFLAAFGAEVIRIEDPTNEGRWDILRGIPPYVDERRGINLGGAFNNHNVEKRGITLNLRTAQGKALVRQLIATSDVVTENFAAGVLARMGLSYEELRAIKPDIIYVSNCGFGHSGPYASFKTWGPSVQAVSGLTFSSGLPDQPPAGWGYSYMDHTGAYYMAMAILMALYHRNETGEGQWIDYATTEAALTLNGPALLDYTVNGRPLRRPGMPHSNRSQSPPMAPHGIYPSALPSHPLRADPSPNAGRGEPDSTDDAEGSPSPSIGRGGRGVRAGWIAIACRTDDDWRALASVIGEAWTGDERFATIAGRIEHENKLDAHISRWTEQREPFDTAARLQEAGVPATVVQSPEQRIDQDPNTSAWGLWPVVEQCEMGSVRVDGIPAHLSETDWHIACGAPCLGEHNAEVLGALLGVGAGDVDRLHAEGVL